VTQCTTAAAALWHDDNHRVRRMLAYLPLETQADKAGGNPATSSTISSVGPAGPAAAVPGGSVTTHTSAMSSGPRSTTGWFGNEYQGADAERTGWLQFLTREAEKFDASGTSLGYETSVVTFAQGQAEERHWGTAAAPQWTIDTMGGIAPFYASPTTAAVRGASVGSEGAHTTSPAQAAMWDQPGPNQEVLNACFASPGYFGTATARVVMRFRFHDYLVRGPEVLYQSTMTVTYTATSATAVSGPVNTAGPSGQASSLRREHYEALVRRFPAWTFYPHG
jgi:hypothetical protein